MLTGAFYAAGGLGLFLLGMSVMAEGLKSLTDDKLRKMIARFTSSPTSGFFTGVLTTALIQSSSATTVAAVGMVHVGLLTFPESLGIIFGANVGTTMTGWIVALLGFKLNLGEVILPVILVGALIRLMGRGMIRSIGTSVSGFGLIFLGISALQIGLAGFEGNVTPESFPPDTFLGRILLVALGIVITLITQSSSAGVATALAAVHVGTISLHQAAALVIGMDIGTTATAAMATIGGNLQACRTGFAHVLYNCFTAISAFALLTPYFAFVQWRWPNIESSNPEIALVSWHTFYNLCCVVIMLPLTGKFANFVLWLFPERGNPLTQRLDPSLLTSPDMALQAVTATVQGIVHELMAVIAPTISQLRKTANRDELACLEDAAAQTRDYLQKIPVRQDVKAQLDQYTNSIHILDHVSRINRRATDERRLAHIRDDEELNSMADQLVDSIGLLRHATFPISKQVMRRFRRTNQQLKTAMRRYRVQSLRRTAAGQSTTKTTLQRMDAARSIRRMVYHIWRIAGHATESLDEREV